MWHMGLSMGGYRGHEVDLLSQPSIQVVLMIEILHDLIYHNVGIMIVIVVHQIF